LKDKQETNYSLRSDFIFTDWLEKKRFALVDISHLMVEPKV